MECQESITKVFFCQGQNWRIALNTIAINTIGEVQAHS